MLQAGAQAVGWMQMRRERQRDWGRKDTAQEFSKILFALEGH